MHMERYPPRTLTRDTVAEIAVAKDTRSVEDRTRINTGEDSEVAYWARTLGISKERLVEIVDKVGDSLGAVRRELSAAADRARD